MAEIPRSGGIRALPGVAPTVRRRPSLGEESFGGGAAAAGAMAAAGKLAQGVEDIAVRAHERAEEAQFNELVARIENQEVTLKTELSRVQGKAALQAADQTIVKWDEFGGELLDEAMTDRTRARLASTLDRQRVALRAFSEPHAQREMVAFEAQSLEERVTGAENAAIVSGDPLRVGLALEDQFIALSRFAQLTGKPPEWLKNNVAARESRIHRGLLVRMIGQGKGLAAKEYLTANKEHLVAGDLLAVEDDVLRGSALGQAQNLADQIEEKYPDPKDQTALLKNQPDLDPQVRAMVEDMLWTRGQRRKVMEAGDYADLQDEVMKAITGPRPLAGLPGILGGLGRPDTAEQAVGPDRWAKLSADDQAKAAKVFRQMELGAEPDMRAGGGSGWQAWTKWSGIPVADRAKMTDAQMWLQLRPLLDDQFYAAALKDREDAKAALAKGENGLSDLGGWEATVKDFLRVNGVTTGDSGPKNAAEQKTAAELEMLIRSRVWAFEKVKKRPADPQERVDIMKAAVKEKVIARAEAPPLAQMLGGVFGQGRYVYREAPRLGVLARTEVPVIPLDKISEAQRTEFRNLLLGRGRLATDEKIERLAGAWSKDDDALLESILEEKD